MCARSQAKLIKAILTQISRSPELYNSVKDNDGYHREKSESCHLHSLQAKSKCCHIHYCIWSKSTFSLDGYIITMYKRMENPTPCDAANDSTQISITHRIWTLSRNKTVPMYLSFHITYHQILSQPNPHFNCHCNIYQDQRKYATKHFFSSFLRK